MAFDRIASRPFIVDSPFLCIIVENTSKLPLFYIRVKHPQVTDDIGEKSTTTTSEKPQQSGWIFPDD